MLGWIAREALTPALGPTALPFVSFFPAIALAAWFGGLGPGVLAVVLAALAAAVFFVDWGKGAGAPPSGPAEGEVKVGFGLGTVHAAGSF